MKILFFAPAEMGRGLTWGQLGQLQTYLYTEYLNQFLAMY